MEHYSNFTLDVIAAYISEGKKKQHLKVLRSRFLPGETLAFFKQNPNTYEQAVTPEVSFDRLRETFPTITDQHIESIQFAESQIRDFVRFVSSEKMSLLHLYQGVEEIPKGTDTWVVNRTQQLPALSINPSARIKKKPPFINWNDAQQIRELFVEIPLPDWTPLPFDDMVYPGGLVQWFLDNNKFRDELKGVALESLDYQELSRLYQKLGLSPRMINNLLAERGLTVEKETPYYQILKITTAKAAHDYCYGNDLLGWCVKDEGYAKDYLTDGPLYVIIDLKPDKYYLFSPGRLELKDESDDPYPPSPLDSLTGGYLTKLTVDSLDRWTKKFTVDRLADYFIPNFFKDLWEGHGKPEKWEIFEELRKRFPRRIDFPLVDMGYVSVEDEDAQFGLAYQMSWTHQTTESQKSFNFLLGEWERLGRPVPWPPFQEYLKLLSTRERTGRSFIPELFGYYISELPQEDLIPSPTLFADTPLVDLLKLLLENQTFLESNFQQITKAFDDRRLRELSELIYSDSPTTLRMMEGSEQLAKSLLFGALAKDPLKRANLIVEYLERSNPEKEDEFFKDMRKESSKEYHLINLLQRQEISEDITEEEFLELCGALSGKIDSSRDLQLMVSKAGELLDEETFTFLLENEITKLARDELGISLRQLQNSDGSLGATLFSRPRQGFDSFTEFLHPDSYITRGVSFSQDNRLQMQLKGKIVIRSKGAMFHDCILEDVEIGENCDMYCELSLMRGSTVEDDCTLTFSATNLIESRILSGSKIDDWETRTGEGNLLKNSTVKSPDLLLASVVLENTSLTTTKHSRMRRIRHIKDSKIDVGRLVLLDASISNSTINVNNLRSKERIRFQRIISSPPSFVENCSLSGFSTLEIPSGWRQGLKDLNLQGNGEDFIPGEDESLSELISKPTYLFKNSDREVPAKMHVNYGNALGGWVADTATVHRGAVIGKQAEVHGYAEVGSGAMIDEKAQVHGEAKVLDSVRVEGKANVFGRAILSENAHVAEESRVSGGYITGNSLVALSFGGSVTGGRIDGKTELYGRVQVRSGYLGFNPTTGEPQDSQLILEGDIIVDGATLLSGHFTSGTYTAETHPPPEPE
jgi:hypothetical protein